MIGRVLESGLLDALTGGSRSVLTLLGPRRVGKTTLLQSLAKAVTGKRTVLNGDYLDDQRLLAPERAVLQRLVSHLDFLFIDEAQNIEHIGTVLKLLHDEFPNVRVLATGSSSFDLTNRTGEPLTGRQRRFTLFPIAFAELAPDAQERGTVYEHAMVYGSYPETLGLRDPADKVEYLRQLVADYLLKDVYRQVEVNRTKLIDMLRLIAFQIGNEVSLSEIARSVQIDAKTVGRYIDLLEQAFVVFRLRGFSRNLRKEVAKSQKIYFVDLGIRNAIIQTFNPLALRADVGALWENYLIVERIKRNTYAGDQANVHFWRTYDKQEIDLVEDRGGELSAFEFKFGSGKARIPAVWSKTYPTSRRVVVTRDDAHEFLALAPTA